MSRDHRPSTPPPRFYDHGWPYVAAIVCVIAVMVLLFVLLVP